jgi:gliding motility associated protien GldN
MKRISVIFVALLGVVMTYAQHSVSFFNEMGTIGLETQELKESSDSLVTLFHRKDDVVWSRVVYRIIDMRFKQNYQLYTPVSAEDLEYSSLFRTMLRAIENGMPVYEKSGNVGDVKPYFNLPPMAKEMIPTVFNTDRTGELGDGDIATSEYMLLNYDSVADKMTFNGYSYNNFVRNQLKFMIQEVIFFDRHYSRLYSKIMAIAPLNVDNAGIYEGMSVMEALYGQILFWVPFDAFRPYMAQQYVTPRGSDSKRVTFDDFFTHKKYTSYLVGVNNVYGRMIPEIATTREDIRKEQERIETELLNIEQDLWEY